MDSGSPCPAAILAALRVELSPIENRLAGRRMVRAEGGSYVAGRLGGHEVILAQTGVGSQAARQAADWLIRGAHPGILIGAGFAGGLRPELATGDIAIAGEVHDPPPPDGDGPRTWTSDAELLEAARKACTDGVRLHVGRISSSRTVLASGEAKRAFGERHGAIATDMESAGIARMANVHDRKALYVRVILDDIDYELPPIDFARILTPGGSVRPFRALGVILSRPSLLAKLPELRQRAHKAAEALAAAVEKIVAALPAS